MKVSNGKLDSSNGWEAVASEFIAARSVVIGVATISNWASYFKAGQKILDAGCGFGGPYTKALIEKNIQVYGIDASETLLKNYQSRFPKAIAKCESVENSSFFNVQFDGILSVGLIFLLPSQDQLAVLGTMAGALKIGGKLLFTSPDQICNWKDSLTGRKSESLGKDAYVQSLREHGLVLVDEYTDEGKGHYYDFQKV